MNIFGNNKSQNIKQIIDNLQTNAQSICNESASAGIGLEAERENMADFIKSSMIATFGEIIDESVATEDAMNVAQMFKNNYADQKEQGLLQENAAVNLMTLTTSIATTMRSPYEASLHRVFDTRVVDKPTFELEEVIATIKAPGGSELELVDAFAKGNTFVDSTEITLTDLSTTGIVPGSAAKNLNLLENKDTLYKLSRDMRISKIDVSVVIETVDTPIAADKIKLKKGCSPYFDAKTSVLNVIYEVTLPDSSVIDVDVTCKVDFGTGYMLHLTADSQVKKVYFIANISHEEHTHPITTGFKNRFTEYIIPTRPHIEVSIPTESKTDNANNQNYLASVDVLSAMTENISVISARLEEGRLKKLLTEAGMYTGVFDFEAPTQFAYGDIEWFKREFIPFLDQAATALKTEYNIDDCHFRVALSPFLIKLLDDVTYLTEKGKGEDQKGAGVLNYSICVKTSASVFYFVSSQSMDDNKMKLVLIPNEFKKSPVKTLAYLKYTSFLTDQIRKAANPKLGAIVYSERNLPLKFTNLTCDVEVSNLAISLTTGSRYIKKA